ALLLRRSRGVRARDRRRHLSGTCRSTWQPLRHLAHHGAGLAGAGARRAAGDRLAGRAADPLQQARLRQRVHPAAVAGRTGAAPARARFGFRRGDRAAAAQFARGDRPCARVRFHPDQRRLRRGAGRPAVHRAGGAPAQRLAMATPRNADRGVACVVEVRRSEPRDPAPPVAWRCGCASITLFSFPADASMTQPVRPPADDGTLVRIRGLTTVLNGKTIFDALDMDIPRGKVTAIMGPSGTGKTTLLKHITGQMRADAGSIQVDGQDVARLSREQLYKLRESIGYLFQNSALLTDFDVFENVAFPLRQHTRLPEVLIRNLVLMKLQAVGLRGAARLSPNELSGGMARRVALARAIVFDPMLILYDEPFVGLDPVALNQVLKLIRTLNQTLGITSVLVAHELEAIKQVADHVFLIANGKVVAQGDPKTIANDGSPWTRQFFGGEADGPVPFQYPAGDYAQALGFAGAAK